MSDINLDIYEALTKKTYIKHLGRVTKVIGLTIESLGPNVKLGGLCTISTLDNGVRILAEVV